MPRHRTVNAEGLARIIAETKALKPGEITGWFHYDPSDDQRRAVVSRGDPRQEDRGYTLRVMRFRHPGEPVMKPRRRTYPAIGNVLAALIRL